MFAAAFAWALTGCGSSSPSHPSGDGDDSADNAGESDTPSRDGGSTTHRMDGSVAITSDGGATNHGDAAVGRALDGGAGMDASTASAVACPGTNWLPLPDDMSARGPWDVGIKTVTIGRLTVEVFYPAQPGSTAGLPDATYNIVSFLPEREQSKVPTDHSPNVTAIGGHLYRDVPLDTGHGPYPAVVFIHGTSSFRVASASVNTHWASRGIIVLAADYPGLKLADQLAATLECGLPQSGSQDIPGDVSAQIAALKAGSGDLAFLANHVDATRLGISGHSQGACVASTLTTDPGVRIVLPLDGSYPADTSDTLESAMFISGMSDSVIGYSAPLIGNVVCPLFSFSTTAAYQASPGPPKVKKRLVGVTGGGHLTPTDLCQKNAQGKNAIEEAQADGVCGIATAVIIGLPALFDCGTIDWQQGIAAVSYASAAALEETLLCKDRSAAFASLKANLPQVGDFQETVK